jgi:hypothetical protein
MGPYQELVIVVLQVLKRSHVSNKKGGGSEVLITAKNWSHSSPSLICSEKSRFFNFTKRAQRILEWEVTSWMEGGGRKTHASGLHVQSGGGEVPKHLPYQWLGGGFEMGAPFGVGDDKSKRPCFLSCLSLFLYSLWRWGNPLPRFLINLSFVLRYIWIPGSRTSIFKLSWQPKNIQVYSLLGCSPYNLYLDQELCRRHFQDEV